MHSSSEPSSDLLSGEMDDFTSESESYDNGADQEDDEDFARRREALDGLEAIVLSFTKQLADGIHTLRSGDKKPKVTIALKKRGKTAGSGAMKQVSFPGRWHGAGARPIAQLLVIIDAVHEAIAEDLPVTKRDIYYRNPELFQNQVTVDRFVDDLAATLEVGRADLNVRASGKGLFCGSSLIIHLKRGGSIHGSNSSGALIPDSGDISHFEVIGALNWVLVVEKEAVFQTLCGLDFAADTHALGPGLILTGKGYPDVATRHLLATLADNLPENVVFAGLVDADPYGLDILSVYACGSAALAHETGLLAPRVRWLGVSLRDVEGFGINSAAVLEMTTRDEKKARAMLARAEDELLEGCRVELEYMIQTNTKAEIEILYEARRTEGRICPSCVVVFFS